MAPFHDPTHAPQGFCSLNQAEIDLRIQKLIEEVATGPAAAGTDGERALPRVITPAELIRRMEPFLVYN